MIKLDDFLTKKKEPAQVLDLSKVKITSKEEFRKYFDKIPECKVKPEKITAESIKIKDKDFSFIPKKRERKQVRDWNYLDPTPPDMKGAKLEDLCPVNIDWKMLTTLRPKTKVEEDMFSRLVQLGKLDLKYQQALKREKPTDWIKKTKNPKSSILEMKVVSCKECGEDFCDGSMCSKLMYDNFYRPQATTTGPSPNLLLPPVGDETRKKKKKKKKKKRKPRKSSPNKGRRKKLGKNSIFNRPASRGCNRDHSRSLTKIIEKRQPRALSLTRSASHERTRTNLYDRRSKSAPRIHFECDFLGSKSTRYEYSSDSCPTRTDYSSQSDSEDQDFGRRFNVSRLRLSGRRKLLSARIGFCERNQSKDSGESSRVSRFVRKCTLYKDYHSDASIPETQNDEEDTSSSTSSSSTPSRSTSKSPKRTLPKSTAKHPPTIQIQFDDLFPNTGFRFPEKIFLSNRSSSSSHKRKDRRVVKEKEVTKVTDGFSKIALEFDEECVKKSGLVLQRPKTGICLHSPRHRISRLSKFSGPYLKARGLFETKS